MLRKIIFVIVAVLALSEATSVQQCKEAKSLTSIKQVNITNCDEPPCRLRAKTIISLVQKFIPDHDVQTLTTSVYAEILGASLPFIGVDNSDACDKIFSLDDKAVRCPLKAGTEYIYKNSFPILSFYPKLAVTVRWALKDNNSDITCFKVPAKITS